MVKRIASDGLATGEMHRNGLMVLNQTMLARKCEVKLCGSRHCSLIYGCHRRPKT